MTQARGVVYRIMALGWAVLLASGCALRTDGTEPSANSTSAAVTIDKTVTLHQTSASTSITSPAFTTSQAGELVVAFIASDGPSPGSQTITAVTGAGLTWRLRQRANAQAGTSEIWQAVASSIVTSGTVKATRASSAIGSIFVATFVGASTSVDGATAGAGALTGAPTATVTTTHPGSWVWAVGNDWDGQVARTVGTNQVKVDEQLASIGDTFWVQRQTSTTPTPGAVVINDTAPTNDRWNLSLIEIPAAGPADTAPPTVPTNLVALASAGQVSLTWTASTDDVGVAGYRVFRGGTQIATSTTTSYVDTSVAGSTTYSYTVRAFDAANNVSADSNAATATTPAAPSPPVISAVSASSITQSGANVGWTTDVASTSQVDYGTTTAYGSSTAFDATLVTSHAQALSGLAPSTVYHYRVKSAKDPNNLAAPGNLAVSADNTFTTASSSNEAVIGQWGPVTAWPEVSIHAALTYTGKILTVQGDFSQGGQQYLFDPSVPATPKQVPTAAADLFCAGQAVTADGRILIVGGTATNGGLGIRNITAFNPATESWTALAPMHTPRWYPTATTLGDGRVLVTSGYNTSSSDLVPMPEIYDVKNDSWSDLAGATLNIPIYPFIYQLPGGRILQAGASEVATSTRVLDLPSQTWTTIDSRVIDGSSINNYAPGKFIKAGTAADDGNTGNSANTVYTLDMNQANPTWQSASPMQFARSFMNLTALPDGTVLATGGGTDRSAAIDANGVLPAEIWDPSTGNWRTVASLSVPRLYHSVAVLLPDGRVFVSGGGGTPIVHDQDSFQIYSPAYLFKGARPTITSAPATVQYGASTFVQTPDASTIASVALIRTGSVTHAFDQNARAMSLGFTQAAGGLAVQMPPDGNTAPPGYYLLFLVNANGVPSIASFVRFPAPYEDSTPPTAPTNLVATSGTGSVTLTWTAATDAVGVASYNVHRSTTSGFTPTSANRVASGVMATSFVDTGLGGGTYFYRVTAQDAATNVSQPSNEATATLAIVDTSPPTAPTALMATAISSTQVALSWSAATDDVGVTRYNVLRNGTPIGTAAGTTYTDATASASTTYTYTVTAQDAANNVGPSSNAAAVTTPAGSAGITLDAEVVTHQSTAGATISSPPLTTTGANEVIVVFLGSDTLTSGLTFSGVSGGGLTWRFRQRANGQFGTSEIWQAVAPSPLSGVVITATRSSGSYQGLMVVQSFKGADTTTDGAVAAASAATGAPSVSLTTTRAGSLVWAVGNDYDNAIARTVGASQSKVDEFLSSLGDTYWVQRSTGPIGSAGTLVTINDTAPAGDRFNLVALEILPAP